MTTRTIAIINTTTHDLGTCVPSAYPRLQAQGWTLVKSSDAQYVSVAITNPISIVFTSDLTANTTAERNYQLTKFVPFQPTAPDPNATKIWVDNSVTPPRLKYWNSGSSAWVASLVGAGSLLLDHGASVPAGTPAGTLIFEKDV